MNKKAVFIVAPMALVMGVLAGCKSNPTPTLDSIKASLIETTSTTFKVGESIKKSNIKVEASYSNNKIEEVTDWTCDTFKNDTYTFVDGDIGTKEFVIKYKTQECKLSVSVVQQEFKVTFVDDSKTIETQTIKKGDKAVAPKGVFGSITHVFDGWYNGNDKFNFETPITSDLTLTSKYVNFTEEAYKECIDYACGYSEGRNFTFVGERGKTINTIKVVGHSEYAQISEKASVKNYNDGINVYKFYDDDERIVEAIQTYNSLYPATNDYFNVSAYGNWVFYLKFGFYDKYSNVTFNKDTGLYEIEAKISTASYNPKIAFDVIDGKLRMRTVDVYYKTTGEYSLNTTYRYSDYGTTKADDTNPKNLVKVEGKSGTCSGTIDIQSGTEYYVSFKVPDDMDTSKTFTILLADNNGNPITLTKVSGKEMNYNASYKTSVATDLTVSESIITPKTNPTSYAICVETDAKQEYKGSTFTISYTAKAEV